MQAATDIRAGLWTTRKLWTPGAKMACEYPFTSRSAATLPQL